MLLSLLDKKVPDRRRIFPSGENTHPLGRISIDPDEIVWITKFQGSVSRLATVDQTEVCPLSRGVMSQPLCSRLQTAIRFFRPPIPAPPSMDLAIHLANQLRLATIRAYHVPCLSHDRLRSRLSPGGTSTT